jgi:intracellular multiplication protein IcmB
MLYNMLGPTELWALSTRPDDIDLRDRLYEALGHRETWRRLALVFPDGTAHEEIERRTHTLTRLGRGKSEAERAVIRDLAIEVTDGVGVAIVLRPSSGIVSGAELEQAYRRKSREWLAGIRN